jgi:hypothetical protein
MQPLRRTGVALVWAAGLLLTTLSTTAQARHCTAPVNLASNGSFDSGLTGYTNTGNWLFNQTLDPGTYGTFYNTRAAVQNPSAAPSGQDASAYPAATSVTLSDPLGGLPATYVTGSLRINGTASGTTCTTYFDVIVN